MASLRIIRTPPSSIAIITLTNDHREGITVEVHGGELAKIRDAIDATGLVPAAAKPVNVVVEID